MPEQIPTLDDNGRTQNMTYQETTYAVMKQFLTDLQRRELKHCIDSTYDSKSLIQK